MHAILYIAGRAQRLGAIATGRNKVLLEFAGKSLLERHVMHLKKLGATRLFLVTGYLRENIQNAIPALSDRYKLPIEELFNADFLEGSALSMHASLPALRNSVSPVLLMDGDVLYDSRILERLITSSHRTALLVDREYATTDDDPVLVPIRAGKPFDFVKKWKPQPGNEADAIGESVGFFKIDPADVSILVEQTVARATGTGRTDSYDDILRAMVQAGLFGAEEVTGLPWTEIDFPHDLEYAKETILPALWD